MCTGFTRRGKDIITGFNFDMNIGGMDYCPVIEKDRVFLGMRLSPEVLAMMPPAIRTKPTESPMYPRLPEKSIC